MTLMYFYLSFLCISILPETLIANFITHITPKVLHSFIILSNFIYGFDVFESSE